MNVTFHCPFFMDAAGTHWMGWTRGLEELCNIHIQSDLPPSDALSSSRGNQNDSHKMKVYKLLLHYLDEWILKISFQEMEVRKWLTCFNITDVQEWRAFIFKRDKCRKTHHNQSQDGKKTPKDKSIVLILNPHLSLQTVTTTRSRAEFKEKCSSRIAKSPETMSDLIVRLLSNQWLLWLVTHWQYNQINVFIPTVGPDALKEWKSGKNYNLK